jgi:hypothetical protein
MKEWMKFYDVSPEVKSLDLEYINSRGQRRRVKSNVFKTSQDRYGYEKVILRCHGANLNTTVGRLVAKKYIPNPKNLPRMGQEQKDRL